MQFGLQSAEENSRTKIYSFGGLNRTRKGNRNEFSNMKNMSADEYPCAAPCGGRKKIAEAQTVINVACAPDSTNVDEVTGITGVADNGFYYNGELKSKSFKLYSDWDWQIERKGNLYIINGYDKTQKQSVLYYYNIDTDDFKEGGSIMRNLVLTSGTNYLSTLSTIKDGIYSYSVTMPDGTVRKNSIFCNSYMNEDYGSGYTMSKEENIFSKLFKVGDEVTIEGFPGRGNNGLLWNVQSGSIVAQSSLTGEKNNTLDTDNLITLDSVGDSVICTATVTEFGITRVTTNMYAHKIYFDLRNKNGEELTFADLIGTSTGKVYCTGVTLRKRTRVLDNITTHHGRIWGTAPSGNQIYSSASDDIFSFMPGDVVKKYAARIPSDTPGTFTALCSYNNDLIAFKPDSITIVSGTNPTNYNAAVINGVGCISPKSVAVTPDGVIFLGYRGFYIYNGSIPQCISSKLNREYLSAVSGYDGNSYFAAAITHDGVREFLEYDMRYGMWYIRDNIDAVGFFGFLNGFYVADDLSLYKAKAEECGEWSFETIRLHDNMLDNKGVNEIWIRAEVSEGAEFGVSTLVGDDEVLAHTRFSKKGLNVYRCPVRLRMGESYRVRLDGKGKVVIYEIELVKYDGGRQYKKC